MRAPTRRIVGFAMILAGLVLFAGVRVWLGTRDWRPLEIPVSLADRHIHTQPFTVNLPDAYDIDIFIDDGLMSRRTANTSPGCWDCCSYGGPQRLKTRWQLSQDGHEAKAGESEGRYLGFFAGTGTYTLDVDVLSHSTCWQFGNPRLRVYTTVDYGGFYGNAVTLTVLLVIGGVIWLLAPVTLSLGRNFAPGDSVQVEAGFEHQSVERRRKKRLPLRESMSALPDRGVLGAGLIMLLLLLLYLMSLPPTPKGIYISIGERNYQQAQAVVGMEPIIVRVRNKNNSVQYLLNNHEVTRAEMSAALKKELSRRAEWVVFVQGDEMLPFQDVVYVIDVANDLHARPVMLTPRMKAEAQ